MMWGKNTEKEIGLGSHGGMVGSIIMVEHIHQSTFLTFLQTIFCRQSPPQELLGASSLE